MTLEIVDRLAIPGIIDVHSHFIPDEVMAASPNDWLRAALFSNAIQLFSRI